MRLKFTRPFILAGLLAAPLPIGCSRTISETETTTRRPGTVTKDTRTVKEKPDGSIVVERERDVDRK